MVFFPESLVESLTSIGKCQVSIKEDKIKHLTCCWQQEMNPKTHLLTIALEIVFNGFITSRTRCKTATYNSKNIKDKRFLFFVKVPPQESNCML